MKNRKMVLGAVLVMLALPVMLALAEAAYFYARNSPNGSIVAAGQKRDYLLYVPRSYDRSKATPLIISMHGAGLWGAAQKEMSQWNRVAERQGLIVVYPSGARGSGPRTWHVDRSAGLMKDVSFISQLIDTLQATYNIDRVRIYANGLSNGGGMAFVLSCTLSHRIAAVGLVASAQTLPWSWCTDRRPVPMIAFHGTADSATPYHGGTSWVSATAFPDIPTWAASWARRNGCGAHPVDSVLAADVTRHEYTNCADGAAVVLYTVHGGGHTWPGGGQMPEWFVGRTSNSVDASSRMWEFFRDHPLK